MAQHTILDLRCPSCGGGASGPSREMPFGAEFRCDHCGITSVLIIDRALVPLSVLQKQGEQVCIACGRMERREARFCQEGHALVQSCIYCGRDFAVDHQRCDFCGRTQDFKIEAMRLLASGVVRDKIAAITLVHECSGLGLEAAKDLVESWER